jgi:hypothetical protein
VKDIDQKAKDLEAWSHESVLKLAQDLLIQNAALTKDLADLLKAIHDHWMATK